MSATAWGRKRVTREDVVRYLLDFDYPHDWLKFPRSVFGGLNAEDFAYRCGWEAVLDICKRVFQ